VFEDVLGDGLGGSAALLQGVDDPLPAEAFERRIHGSPAPTSTTQRGKGVGTSMVLPMLLTILLNAVHAPAVSNVLTFSMRLDRNDSLTLFALAVVITVVFACFSEQCRGYFGERHDQNRRI
jgi:hypothetical protein